MDKKIVFPFSVDTSYYEGYSWASELAYKFGTNLLLFTTCKQKDESSLQKIFNSLLKAQGHYLQFVRNSRPLKTERFIETGDLIHPLLRFLQDKKNNNTIIVIDPSFPVADKAQLNEIIDTASGVVVLSSELSVATNDPEGDFYEKLRTAELYKLPNDFFDTLSHDRSVFNYLRNFFKKKK